MAGGGVLWRGFLRGTSPSAVGTPVAQHHGEVVGPVVRQQHQHEPDEDEQDSGQLHPLEHHFVHVDVYDRRNWHCKRQSKREEYFERPDNAKVS